MTVVLSCQLLLLKKLFFLNEQLKMKSNYDTSVIKFITKTTFLHEILLIKYEMTKYKDSEINFKDLFTTDVMLEFCSQKT